MCLIIMAVGVTHRYLHQPGLTPSRRSGRICQQYASVRHADLELHVHHGRVRRNFRLPFHAVSADGALHEELRSRATSYSTAQWYAEGIIALIWAAAGCALYEVTGGLNTGLAEALAGRSVRSDLRRMLRRPWAALVSRLAMIGVVVCPITSGDTAFRSARLTLVRLVPCSTRAPTKNRLKLCVPVTRYRCDPRHRQCDRPDRLHASSGATSAGPTRRSR